MHVCLEAVFWGHNEYFRITIFSSQVSFVHSSIGIDIIWILQLQLHGATSKSCCSELGCPSAS